MMKATRNLLIVGLLLFSSLLQFQELPFATIHCTTLSDLRRHSQLQNDPCPWLFSQHMLNSISLQLEQSINYALWLGFCIIRGLLENWKINEIIKK